MSSQNPKVSLVSRWPCVMEVAANGAHSLSGLKTRLVKGSSAFFFFFYNGLVESTGSCCFNNKLHLVYSSLMLIILSLILQCVNGHHYWNKAGLCVFVYIHLTTELKNKSKTTGGLLFHVEHSWLLLVSLGWDLVWCLLAHTVDMPPPPPPAIISGLHQVRARTSEHSTLSVSFIQIENHRPLIVPCGQPLSTGVLKKKKSNSCRDLRCSRGRRLLEQSHEEEKKSVVSTTNAEELPNHSKGHNQHSLLSVGLTVW